MDTQRVEEIPAKEPKPNAVPLKSALKKKGGVCGGGPNSQSTPVTPTQEHHSAAAAAAIANSNGGIGSMAAAAAAAAQQSASQRPLVVRQDATGNNYSLKWVHPRARHATRQCCNMQRQLFVICSSCVFRFIWFVAWNCFYLSPALSLFLSLPSLSLYSHFILLPQQYYLALPVHAPHAPAPSCSNWIFHIIFFYNISLPVWVSCSRFVSVSFLSSCMLCVVDTFVFFFYLFTLPLSTTTTTTTTLTTTTYKKTSTIQTTTTTTTITKYNQPNNNNPLSLSITDLRYRYRYGYRLMYRNQANITTTD